MKKQAKEDARKRIVNFYNDAAGGNAKSTVNFFVKQGMKRRTVYTTLQHYKKYGLTTDLPRSGRPVKLSNRKLASLVRKVNNKAGVSQRQLAKHYNVAQSTISRNLKKRTKVRIYKRTKAPKYSKSQWERVRKNCGQLYRKISNDYFVIMDDEKYFSLSNVNMPGNAYYYTSDNTTAPPDIKYNKKSKYEPKIMIWLAMSSKGVSEPYIHRSKGAINADTYLNQCIKSKLIPFINKYHPTDDVIFWPDLAQAHYSTEVLVFLEASYVSVVPKAINPPNIPQGRPIEDFWGVLAQLVYEKNWETTTVKQLERRIRKKLKEIDITLLQSMMEKVKNNLRKMYTDGVFSTCH